MSATITTAPEVTSYQAAWLERKKKHNRFARLVNYGLLAVFGVTIAIFVTQLFNIFSILLFSEDAVAKLNAARVGGAWAGGLMIFIIVLGMFSLPLLRAVSWSEWGLGEYPADDFKPREAKPINVKVESISEDVRYFHVTGLNRTGEDYTFQVERFTSKPSQAKHSYRITENTEKAWIHYTMDSSCFKGMSEDAITQHLIDTISMHLEDNTDHFKELNYAI